MPPATGELYQATYGMVIDGQQCENVIHFRANAVPGPTEADVKLSIERYLHAIAVIQVSTVSYNKIILKQMTPSAFDELIWVPTSITTGAIGAVPVNNTVALIFTKRTGVAGKSHRGRIYLPGIASSRVDVNRLNAFGLADSATVADTLTNVYGPAGVDTNFKAGIYSRVLGGSSPFTVTGWQQVTRYDPQTVLGNQRRRRPGVGI